MKTIQKNPKFNVAASYDISSRSERVGKGGFDVSGKYQAVKEYNDEMNRLIEEITKNNNQERQELVEKTKEELEKTIENSRNKIKEFITASEQKSQSAIAELTIKIREKLVKNV